MRIVKCLKCGNYIHKTDKCFFCGNVDGFGEIEMPIVHKNVLEEYLQVESFVKNRKFKEAISSSYKVIEWMPDLSGIFWFRFLAKNKCVSASEVIKKGSCCEEDADFCNALMFSTASEHSAYLNIQKAMEIVKTVLKGAVCKHEYDCKTRTGVLGIKRTIDSEISDRREKIFSLWSDLVGMECKLQALEMDCDLVSKEHREVLKKSEVAATVLLKEVSLLKECTAKEHYKYGIKMQNIVKQSGEAKKILDDYEKQYPCIREFNEMLSKRNWQVQCIEKELVSLKQYEDFVRKTLMEIDEIEKIHKKVFLEVEKYNFQAAVDLLGNDRFEQIFNDIDFVMDV